MLLHAFTVHAQFALRREFTLLAGLLQADFDIREGQVARRVEVRSRQIGGIDAPISA